MSREKQIEEIRKDIFAAFGGYAKWEEDWQSLAEAVYNAGYRKQSEDNVEVVRCKDCEYWNPMDNGISWHNKGRIDGDCDMLHRVHYAERQLTEQDHFCSYGKMKGGAE